MPEAGSIMKIKMHLLCLISIIAAEILAGICFYPCMERLVREGQRPARQVDSGEKNEIMEWPRGEPHEKLVALTFDDGPHPVYTPLLLKGLKERGVHATFFLIGKSIEGNEDIVRQMKEDGHLIGNHSNSHVQLTKKTAKLACEEINTTNQKIYDITGELPQYIRPPYGSYSEELECMIPMTVVLWDVDPLDWKALNTRKIVQHILKKTEDNDIILLHDVYGTSVEATLEVIDKLQKKGYTFVTVDELLID